MKNGVPYEVVPHLDRFRVIGASGEAALVTFAEKAEADKFCRMLVVAYRHGALAVLEGVKAVVGGGP